MEKRVAIAPDFNFNPQIEAAAQTAGAYAGAAVTAVVGGFLTGLKSLVQGAVVGATVTHQNQGTQEIAVVNTAKAKPVTSIMDPAPATSKPFGLEDISEEDLMELLRLKRERQLATSTNGH